MAEPLKNSFGPDVPRRIAESLHAVWPALDVDVFIEDCLDGWDELELTPRGRRVADVMAEHLPQERAEAIEIVLASFGPELPNIDPDEITERDGDPMAGFIYMPHGYFVSTYCTEAYDAALHANYELTKRFTAEFSIRALLEAEPERTLAALREWAGDANVHVRRLVSEGTRPRLPWSSRLPAFQADPEPVIELLERLKDDPAEYVRRSVANNLNDIAKDHPDRVVEIAARWWNDGDDTRRRLVKHALRTLIKQGHAGALDILGYGRTSAAEIVATSIDPGTAEIGGSVQIRIELHNPSREDAGALVDVRVHFVKADGSTSPKVFKGGEVMIEPGERATITKRISVRQHSTRRHYPGDHDVEAMINGVTHPIGRFELIASDDG